MTTSVTKQQLHVRVSRATEVLWEGDAQSVSSENSEGPFDILPMHANFITIVEKKPIVLDKNTVSEQSFKFDKAVLFVRNNTVRVFADL